jgi:hypothetical protein
MISMNCSPPRAIDTARPAMLPGGEGPDAEQAELEERIPDHALDPHESGKEDGARAEHAEDDRIGPAHGVVPIRLEAVGDGDEDGAEADGEGDVAPPVDTAAVSFRGVTQHAVGPQRSEHTNGHVDPEHRTPIQNRQQTSRDQADELPGDGRDLIDAERKAALIRGEGVGQDCGRIGCEHGPTECLGHAPADQPQRSVSTLERIKRKQD